MRAEQKALRRAWERSGLTQKRFIRELDLINPRTGKPYHDRTLRKWLGGERSMKRVEPQLRRGGGYYQQHFFDDEGRHYSVIVANPIQNTKLDMFTQAGEKERLRSVRTAVNERLLKRDTSSERWFRQLERKYGPAMAEKYRPIKSGRGIHLGPLQRVRGTRAHVQALGTISGKGEMTFVEDEKGRRYLL
jgi:hypothetical protein